MNSEGKQKMSLRDDIEALTAAFRHLSRAHDRSSNTSGGSYNAQRDIGAAVMDKRRERRVEFNSDPSPISDVSISAISVAQEEEEEDDDSEGGHKRSPRWKVLPQETPLMLPRRKADDDMMAAPPSSNTTALPCTDSVYAFRGTRDGPSGSVDSLPSSQALTSRACSAAIRKSNEKGAQSLSTRVDDIARIRTNLSNATFASSDGSGASIDLRAPDPGHGRTEEAYRHLARKLLAEIERLDARTAAVSAQCEGERQEWVRAQRDLQQQILERDTLIGTLRRHLLKLHVNPDVASGCWSSEPAVLAHGSTRDSTRSVSNERMTTGSWSDSCARTRVAVPLNHRPTVQSGMYCMSSSSAAEVASRPAPQRTPEESEKGEFSTQARSGTAEDDVTSTRAHSLTEFLQRKFSSLRPAFPSDDAALRMCSTPAAAAAAAQPARREASLGGSPIPVYHAEAGDDAIRGCQAEKKFLPLKNPTRADPKGNKGDMIGAVFAERLRIPPASPQPRLSERCSRRDAYAPIESDCCEELQHRLRNKTPSHISSCSRKKQNHRSNTNGDHCNSCSCRPCCRDQAATVVHTVPPAARRGRSRGGHLTAQSDQKKTCVVCRRFLSGPAEAKGGKRKKMERESESRKMLYGLQAKSTVMEARLQDLKQRLEKQEMGLQDVTRILCDVVLPLAAGSSSESEPFPSRCVSPQKQGTKV